MLHVQFAHGTPFGLFHIFSNLLKKTTTVACTLYIVHVHSMHMPNPFGLVMRLANFC